MIDTHAHIDTEAFDGDRDDVIARAVESGVGCIIIPAINPAGFDKLFDVADSSPHLKCGVGIHPHHALECNGTELARIRREAKREKVVAIGEIGLDYYYDFAPVDVQKNVFRDQLRIARETCLPVIVHNREADSDILEILGQEQDGTLGGVLHCFSSPADTLQKALDLGFHVSFTGNITFKKSTMDEVVMNAPLDRIMLETDSPYMTPVPFRGKRNEPSLVRLVAQKIAEIKSVTIEEVIKMTTINAKKLFNLSLIFVLAFIMASPAWSQLKNIKINEPEDDQLEEEVNPYRKYIGISPVLGINTIVYTYYLEEGQLDISNEGITAYGASLNIGLFNFLVFEATYLYSKNEKIAKDWNYLLNPNYHRFAEFSLHWIANPWGRINIFATTGLSAVFNSIGRRTYEGFYENNQLGINTGIGAYINIPTKWGLIAPSFGWRLNFPLGKIQSNYARRVSGQTEPEIIETNVSTFFSIPRLQVIWFLPFKW